MRRVARRKLIIQDLQNKLQKYERRIQQMAENAYKVRQAIEMFSREDSDATRDSGSEGQSSDGSANRDDGSIKLPDLDATEAVLGEQQEKLSSH